MFVYPNSPHSRRHGPQGYTDYPSFKPWLRDEFLFRCVYCLVRERWHQDGEALFSVDHLTPQSEYPAGVCDYENLVYACSRCNSLKGASLSVLNPCEEGYGQYLEIRENGEVVVTTQAGIRPQIEKHIQILRLNAPSRIAFRRTMMAHLQQWETTTDAKNQQELGTYWAFPDDLPDLPSLHPPGGNKRPAELNNCCYVLRKNGTLPLFYRKEFRP